MRCPRTAPAARSATSASPATTCRSAVFPNYPGVESYDPSHEGLDTSAFARLQSPGQLSNGSAIAYTESQPGDLLPTLKAGAFTRPNNLGRYSTSYAFVSTLYAYTFNGAVATPLPLIGTLDAIITFGPVSGPGAMYYSFGQLRGRGLAVATEALYTGTRLNPFAMECGATGILATGGGSVVKGGYASGGITQNVSLGFNLTTGCDGRPLTISPGQRFYVYAFMDVVGAQGGTTDATHSFNLGLAPGTPPAVQAALVHGVSLVNAVPEPATWSLMIAGFGLAGSAMRRRRSLAGLPGEAGAAGSAADPCAPRRSAGRRR